MDEIWEAFGKDPSRALGRITEELAHQQRQHHAAASARKVGDGPTIPTMDACRFLLAERAAPGWATSNDRDDKLLLTQRNALDV